MFFDRSAPPQALQRPAKTHVFPGPVRGWIRNESLALPKGGGAEKLDNWFPTPEGARMRAGSVKHATIDAAVTRLMTYDTGAGQTLFATDATSIYDVTSPADPDVAVTALVTGLTSGDWADEQFATSAGDYLIAVNGADDQQLFDGSFWFPIDTQTISSLDYDAQTGNFAVGLTLTGGSSGATATILQQDDQGTDGTLWLGTVTGTFQNNETITDSASGSATSDGTISTKYTGITNVATAALSQVWAFKKRLFYIEKNTLSAWYLGTLAIGGSATEFPLKGLFKKGGALLFGTTWSNDAGDGLDDYCLFVTTEGEVAVYQGIDPASFALVGVYQIGKPLGKNAHFRAGGDVAVLADDGILPISAAVSKTGAALSGDAITYPIEEEWSTVIRERKTAGAFSAVLWHDKTALMVGVPSVSGRDDIMLVANSRTGAWCRYTGWAATSVAVLDDKFYFGTASATVVQGETTGKDQAVTYSAVYIPRFDMLGVPAEKAALHVRFIGRVENTITPQLFANADYGVSVPTPLAADAEVTTGLWGSGKWGTSKWAAPRIKTTLTRWQAVAALGQALAPGVQITTGRAVAPDVELVALHLQYETGRVMG